MKYFFLSEGWSVSRVWASDGLWQITAWRRQPDIQQLNICLIENNELLWLYRVEDAILTVEVKPTTPVPVQNTIGQVVLKRLMTMRTGNRTFGYSTSQVSIAEHAISYIVATGD